MKEKTHYSQEFYVHLAIARYPLSPIAQVETCGELGLPAPDQKDASKVREAKADRVKGETDKS
jgi:hypothetical protein